jgi:hypothetical protein
VAVAEVPREERRPRREEPRRDRDGLPDLPRENRRDEYRRERREDRDAGPTPRGFGDAVPAFMLVPIPRPRREANGGEATEAEAA